MTLECALIDADSIDKFAPKALLFVDPITSSGGHPVHTGLTHLGAQPVRPGTETWLTGDQVASGRTGEVSWSTSEKDLFISTAITEDMPLSEASYQAYLRLFDFLDDFQGFTICRVWNFVRNRNCIYLQATCNDVVFFENPRQISACQYPGQYGPSSPSFSRASLVLDGTTGRLLDG